MSVTEPQVLNVGRVSSLVNKHCGVRLRRHFWTVPLPSHELCSSDKTAGRWALSLGTLSNKLSIKYSIRTGGWLKSEECGVAHEFSQSPIRPTAEGPRAVKPVCAFSFIIVHPGTENREILWTKTGSLISNQVKPKYTRNIQVCPPWEFRLAASSSSHLIRYILLLKFLLRAC